MSLFVLSCRGAGARSDRCALIETDDDITSGSATAGALYVGEDERGRRLLTSDVLAVAHGFRDAGIGCIVIVDSHADGDERAIDAERVKRAGLRLLTPDSPEWRWPFFGIADPEIEIAALVGFHARAGARGFRPHTVNDYVKRITIAGVEVGEVAVGVLGLSAVGIAPVLVVGDEGAVAEAEAFMPGVRTVSVRWHDEQGAVRFLFAGQARSKIRRVARAAAEQPPAPPTWRFPLELAVEARVERRAAPALEAARADFAERRRRLGHAAGADSFSPVTDRGRITWTAADGRSAYLSLVAVASSLRPPRRDEAWDRIGRGFEAFRDGRLDDAERAYSEALAIDPSDSETRCRVGQVHLARGSLGEALADFEDGVRHLDEMSEPMRAVCLLGLARTHDQSGHPAEAAATYGRVLEVPDHNGSHEKARAAIRRARGE